MQSSKEQEVFIEISNVEPVTKSTVIQKVLSPQQVEEYLNGRKKDVTGWAFKASDVAPYAKNLISAYQNLHLDYRGSVFTELLKKQEGLYVLRCTTDGIPNNSDQPRVDLGKNPVSLDIKNQGLEVVLIPEYNYGFGKRITDGAIFYLDAKAREYLVAVWNVRKQRFDSVGK